MFSHPKVSNSLVEQVLACKPKIEHSIHGLEHWQRVESNGLKIAENEGADLLVVSLFALFHDSQRINDYVDPQHGYRGALLANDFFLEDKLPINEFQCEILFEACRDHTDITFHSNVTIQCCWDADRLDLTRIGIQPDPKQLNTETAKKLASLVPNH